MDHNRIRLAIVESWARSQRACIFTRREWDQQVADSKGRVWWFVYTNSSKSYERSCSSLR